MTSQSNFIGRGEGTVGHVLGRVFGKMNIIPQYTFEHLIDNKEDFEWFDTEVQKHKFDFYVGRYHKQGLMIEVNYEHGEKAYRKWDKIFTPELVQRDILPVTIEQIECKHLFKDKKHTVDLQDWIEVLSELKRCGVVL